MNRVVVAAGLLLVTASVASACGSKDSSTESDYCGQVKAAQSDFSSIAEGDYDSLENAFAAMHRLNDAAPASLEDDWATMDNAISDMEAAFADAGLKISDLGQISSGKTPPGVRVEKLQAAMEKTQALASKDVVAAQNHIESDAQEQCGIEGSLF